MTAPITKEEWAEARRSATEVLPDIVDKLGLPKALLPYQGNLLETLESSTCHVLFVEKSRRIGLTFGFAAYAALRAARAKAAGGMDVMYISYSQEMTREFIDACAMWSRAFNQAAMAVDEFLFDDSDKDGERAIQAFRIRFASGFEVLALSSAPRSLRGKQGVVMIDEAAFVDNLKELLKAALAFLMWGGQVVVCSTHDGTENEFNLQIRDILGGRKPYHHMRIDFDEALRQGLYERICLVNGATWTPEAEAIWRQDIIDFYGDGADEELFCIPTMGTGSWLSAPLIEARMTSDAPVLSLDLPTNFLQRPELERRVLLSPFMEELEAALEVLDQNLLYAFGFDFARVADLSVGTLLSLDKMLKRRSALTVELRNVPGDEQKMIVRTILSAVTRMVGAAFDATGMGWTVAEDMGRLFGLRENEDSSGLVWAIKFTQDWYRINMPPLKVAFEDDAISISKNDNHLTDLRSVKVIAGIPRVPDVRSGEGPKKRHGDYAIALALAHFASRMQWHDYGYRRAPIPLDRFSEPAERQGDDGRFRMSTLKRARGLF
ncbi:terminase large subunit domain-containing protein [Rhizobium halophytocola]|uniref:Phage FluMu gp28-like protein n=1 Tax=Rhizobium halophytocola TaxID=735519 RepID=A0ABS4E460_9HYPH|nr:terminase family protein [Rhizobium halophytocola]MBP1852696.1 phage FluMu gp28-like protein [Rhizobium halophytocola]